jgi:phosphatidylglycerophosphate synthase
MEQKNIEKRDNPEDKKETFQEFKKRAQKEKGAIMNLMFFYPLSVRIAYFLNKTNPNINPNSITKLRLYFISPLILLFLFLAPFTGNKIFYLLSIVLFYFFHLSDCVDGELARGSGKTSKKGVFLDNISDRYATIIFIVSAFSIGLFIKENALIYGSVVLFSIKSFHSTVIIMFYKYMESLRDEKNKSVLGGGEGMKKTGAKKIIDSLTKALKPILPKKCHTVFSSTIERYTLTIIIPLLLVYLEINFIAFALELFLLLFFIVFYTIRIKSLIKKVK